MKTKHPYCIIQRRIDTITRVPTWAGGGDLLLKVGVEVVRLDEQTVYLVGSGKYKLGESYTKFNRYTTPLEMF